MSFEKPTIEAEPVNPKLKRFDEIEASLETVYDAEGKGLDGGIKETVAGLMAHGFNTVQSCEGHVNESEGYPAPWVSIADLARPQWKYEGQKEIWEAVAAERDIALEDLRAFKDERAYQEAQDREQEFLQKNQTEKGESLVQDTEEYQEWTVRNLELKRKAQELLDEFYTSRQGVDESKHIVVDGDEGGFRIHNGGADYAEHDKEVIEEVKKSRSNEETHALAERLRGYQEEMNVFAHFLRDKFLRE